MPVDTEAMALLESACATYKQPAGVVQIGCLHDRAPDHARAACRVISNYASDSDGCALAWLCFHRSRRCLAQVGAVPKQLSLGASHRLPPGLRARPRAAERAPHVPLRECLLLRVRFVLSAKTGHTRKLAWSEVSHVAPSGGS